MRKTGACMKKEKGNPTQNACSQSLPSISASFMYNAMLKRKSFFAPSFSKTRRKGEVRRKRGMELHRSLWFLGRLCLETRDSWQECGCQRAVGLTKLPHPLAVVCVAGGDRPDTLALMLMVVHARRVQLDNTVQRLGTCQSRMWRRENACDGVGNLIILPSSIESITTSTAWASQIWLYAQDIWGLFCLKERKNRRSGKECRW